MNKLKQISIAAALMFLSLPVNAGSPAARVGDYHTCPASDYSFPNLFVHVGGPITNGSPTVLICGMPAAYLGSNASCNSPVRPVDVIVSASPTVFISGLPVARTGSNTQHGGVVTAGCQTVLIGP